MSWTSQVLPLLVGGTFYVVVVFIIQTGNKNKTWTPTSDAEMAWIGAVVCAGTAILAAVLIFGVLKKKIIGAEAARDACASSRIPSVLCADHGIREQRLRATMRHCR